MLTFNIFIVNMLNVIFDNVKCLGYYNIIISINKLFIWNQNLNILI